MTTRFSLPMIVVWALLSSSVTLPASAADNNCDGVDDNPLIHVVLPPVHSCQHDPEQGPCACDDSALPDDIWIPNGRPIYALFVHGFTQNSDFDLLLCYEFARHLMDNGAYVHYAWWNNLCAPYMARPLHQADSYPGTRDEGMDSMWDPSVPKAKPAEDFQFLADAKRYLTAIRNNNPNAMIILLGHSMGGGAVVHLASDPEVQEIGIDILAPIDPVDNRQTVSGRLHVLPFQPGQSFPDGMYTRWRITHEEFKGYKPRDASCAPYGETWYGFLEMPMNGHCFGTLLNPFVHNPDPLEFHSGIINLYHRWQEEYIFPFDYYDSYEFVHDPIAGGSEDQAAVQCCGTLGWDYTLNDWCYGHDGHGEIVGYKAASQFDTETQPYGLKAQNWPIGAHADSVARRRELLIEMETAPFDWAHRPKFPELCMVSTDLCLLFNRMNKAPRAHAGEDRVVECSRNGMATVILDGYAYDPDTLDPAKNEVLAFSWDGPFGELEGPTVEVSLPLGKHAIRMYVQDKVGHSDCDLIEVDVVDTKPPEVQIVLSPRSLWPPNHKMVDVEAIIVATDICDDDIALELLSITSGEPGNGRGDGHTNGDIGGAEFGTNDQSFQLRAERAGGNGGRVYTVTYRAVDASGNDTIVSAEVVVENLPPDPPREFTVSYNPGAGNSLDWLPSPDPDFDHFAIYRSVISDFSPSAENLIWTTTNHQFIDPRRDDRGVFYRVVSFDQTGQQSLPSSNGIVVERDCGAESITGYFTSLVFEFGGDQGRENLSTLVIPGGPVRDVRDINAASIRLLGAHPSKYHYADVVSRHVNTGDDCDGPINTPDGIEDLTLYYATAEQSRVLAISHDQRSMFTAEITGRLHDGRTISGICCVREPRAVHSDPFDQSEGIELLANYPNPFNPITQISFVLARATEIRLEVFDAAGRRVTVLLDHELESGPHTVTWDAGGLSSGVYFCRLWAERHYKTKKLVLLK